MTRSPDVVLVVGAGPAVWEVRLRGEVFYWNPSFARALAHGRLLAGMLGSARVVVQGLDDEEPAADDDERFARPRRRSLRAPGLPGSRARERRRVRPAGGRPARPPSAPR